MTVFQYLLSYNYPLCKGPWAGHLSYPYGSSIEMLIQTEAVRSDVSGRNMNEAVPI